MHVFALLKVNFKCRIGTDYCFSKKKSQLCCFITYKRYKKKGNRGFFLIDNLHARHMKFKRYSSWLGRIKVINLFYLKCAACDIRIIKPPKWQTRFLLEQRFTSLCVIKISELIIHFLKKKERKRNKLCKRDRQQTMSFTTLKFSIHLKKIMLLVKVK